MNLTDAALPVAFHMTCAGCGASPQYQLSFYVGLPRAGLSQFMGPTTRPGRPQPTAADSSTRRSPPRLVTDTIVPLHRSSMVGAPGPTKTGRASSPPNRAGA